jgi:hypothetical protein
MSVMMLQRSGMPKCGGVLAGVKAKPFRVACGQS